MTSALSLSVALAASAAELRPIDTSKLTGGVGCWLRSRGRVVPIRDGVGDDKAVKNVGPARPVWFRNLHPGPYEKDPEIYVVLAPRPPDDAEDFDAYTKRSLERVREQRHALPSAAEVDAPVDRPAAATDRNADAMADLYAELEERRAEGAAAKQLREQLDDMRQDLEGVMKGMRDRDSKITELGEAVKERDAIIEELASQLEATSTELATLRAAAAPPAPPPAETSSKTNKAPKA